MPRDEVTPLHKYLIAYDISNDKIRRQAAKLMEKHGQRLQRSVYIVDAKKREMDRIENILGKLLEANDKLLVMPCCESCFANTRVSTANEPVFMAA